LKLIVHVNARVQSADQDMDIFPILVVDSPIVDVTTSGLMRALARPELYCALFYTYNLYSSGLMHALFLQVSQARVVREC
jgi:hypothetical protein